MNHVRILQIANDPDVPKFVFGSKELVDWTRRHRNPHTGEAIESSGFYVVVHRSLNPAQRPDFRVLSRWDWGKVFPTSWDVPDSVALSSHELCQYFSIAIYPVEALKASPPADEAGKFFVSCLAGAFEDVASIPLADSIEEAEELAVRHLHLEARYAELGSTSKSEEMEVRGRRYRAFESPVPGRCGNCAFKKGFGCALAEATGDALSRCSAQHRPDGRSMYWVPAHLAQEKQQHVD